MEGPLLLPSHPTRRRMKDEAEKGVTAAQKCIEMINARRKRPRPPPPNQRAMASLVSLYTGGAALMLPTPLLCK